MKSIVKSGAEEHDQNPMSLIQIAVEKDFDIDKLEKLMQLKERWEEKQAKKSFLSALSRFQSMAPVLKKNKTAKVQTKTGGQYSYRYADLGNIIQGIKKPLNECGLSYRWEFSEANGKMKADCIISHLDGHSEITTMESGLDNSGAKNDIQQKGSTQTYLQRYSLIGALGLTTADEDNDGKDNSPVSEGSQPKSEEETIDQWKKSLSAISNKTELNKLYVQNQKAVDGNEKLKAMFKQRQSEIATPPKVDMP